MDRVTLRAFLPRHDSGPCMQFPSRRLPAAVLIALGFVGCASLPRAIVPCPLTYSEQEKELLAIVPKGIRREEALRRLAAAGVEGSFGISHRVYYCDLWNRSNGDAGTSTSPCCLTMWASSTRRKWPRPMCPPCRKRRASEAPRNRVRPPRSRRPRPPSPPPSIRSTSV